MTVNPTPTLRFFRDWGRPPNYSGRLPGTAAISTAARLPLTELGTDRADECLMMNKASFHWVAFWLPVSGLIGWMLSRAGLRVPVGYQDGNGFHPGIEGDNAE